MGLDGVRRTIAGCAFASVCLTPFLFGTVERSQWIPLWDLWVILGLISVLLEKRIRGTGSGSANHAVARALLPVHAFFALQLLPLPASLLALVSPGSFAAHFLPDRGLGPFQPISVSPGSTVEAWLYVVGLQGLYLALQGLPVRIRKAFLHALLLVLALLAGEGLWQSRSAHPYWLYGTVPVVVSSGLETSIFGPYFNRNHFATVMAMGCGLAAGFARTRTREPGGLVGLLSQPASMAWAILTWGLAFFFLITAVASGSRSGALAALMAVGWLSLRGIGKGSLLAVLSVGLGGLALGGAAAFERLQRLDIFASRITPWIDMTTLFRFFPVAGSGFGTFAVTYWPYQTNLTYEFWQHAHNDYLQLAIEGGILGLLSIALAARRASRSLAVPPGLRDPLLGAASGFAVQALFDLPSHVPANAALLVCILSLATVRRASSPVFHPKS